MATSSRDPGLAAAGQASRLSGFFHSIQFFFLFSNCRLLGARLWRIPSGGLTDGSTYGRQTGVSGKEGRGKDGEGEIRAKKIKKVHPRAKRATKPEVFCFR